MKIVTILTNVEVIEDGTTDKNDLVPKYWYYQYIMQ